MTLRYLFCSWNSIEITEQIKNLSQDKSIADLSEEEIIEGIEWDRSGPINKIMTTENLLSESTKEDKPRKV